MPVYMGIAHEQPDLVVLVHSHETLAEAKKIQSGCGAPQVRLHEIDAVDYVTIFHAARQLVKEYADDEVSINVTSGTKPWSVAFALLSVLYDNTRTFYIDQHNVCHWLKEMTKEQFPCIDDIDTLLRYNNQQGYRFTRFSDYTPDDFHMVELVREARRWNFEDFNTLTVPSKDKKWDNEINQMVASQRTLPSGSRVSFDKRLQTVELFIYNRRGYGQPWTIQSPHAIEIVFNAGWFECQVATVLARWSQAKEVWLNVKFPYVSGKAKNEIDIIVNTGGKLLFVECKTSIYDNTTIDKFNNAVRNYGGMGSKKLFVTELKFSLESLEKCKESSIMTYCLCNNDRHRTLKNDQELFQMLEREMSNTNKK